MTQRSDNEGTTCSPESYSHGFSTLTEAPASPSTSGARVANVLVDVLVEAGVDVVFGLPGGAIAPLHDALLDHPEVRVITSRHEAGAMFAAQAYARVTGRIGVVLVTSGPGILNAMTGLASAHCDGMPVIVLVGEVPRQVFGRQALQEGTAHHLDVIAACRAMTKLAVQVPSPDLAPSILKRAIATALSGRRGPVVLTLPLDVMSKIIHAPRLVADVSVAHGVESPDMRRAVTDVASLLARAKRPLLFAGSGARWGEGPARLRELAERLQSPVMTTPKAKGVFPESHPLSLGVYGHGGHPSSAAYLERGVDVLLVIGSGLGDPATNGWSPQLGAARSFVQIDADAMQIGRNYPVSHGLVGQASVLLAEITARLPERARPLASFGVARYTAPEEQEHGPQGLITPMRALWELQRALPSNTTFSCDIGEHLLFTTHYLQIDDPQSFIIMTGLGSMGSGIAAALGARLGRPERPAAAICGDGCFSMSLGDLAVAARDHVPLVVAVLNDERYGMVEIGHQAVYGRHPEYPAGPMNVALMAQSVGAAAVTIERANQIATIDFAAILAQRPLVLDIRIDREIKMPRNARNEGMKIVVPGRALN